MMRGQRAGGGPAAGRKYEFGRERPLTGTLKGLRKAGTMGYGAALSRLKRCVETLDEKKLAALRTSLDKIELAILERRVLAEFPESLGQLGEDLNLSREWIRQREKKLLGKVIGGEKIPARKWEGRRVRNIRRMLGKRLGDGGTVEEIGYNIGLHRIQRRVLDIYVMSEEPITQRQTAEKLGIKEARVTTAVGSIEMALIRIEKEAG